MATTDEEIRSIEPGSLLFFGYKGEYTVVVLKHKPMRIPDAIAAFEVLWPDGVVQEIFFWPQDCQYATIIPPNPITEV